MKGDFIMKYRTTQKAVKEGYTYTIQVPYCELQSLLAYHTPDAYTARREGWGADVYDFGNTAIITGYAPFGSIRPDYDTLKKYESETHEISKQHLDFTETQKAINGLLHEFIDIVTGRA